LQIEVDDEVWKALKGKAEPLVDTPNSVLRREFGLDPHPEHDGRCGPMTSRTERAPFGALLPEREYEEPILEALAEAGGTAPSSWVTKAVGERLAERLTPLDRERLASGEIRWANRVHFTRLRLVERGFLKKGSRRGIWEITEAGRARVEDRRS